jgi:AraC-like DNA-binding protein
VPDRRASSIDSGIGMALRSERKSKRNELGALPSAFGGFTRFACVRAKKAGTALAPLLRKVGLTIRQIEDRGARINVDDQIKLLNLTAVELRDDFLGFHLAQDFDLRQIGLTYYVLASSQTLGDALRRAERYSTIANEAIILKYLEGKDVAITFTYVGVARHSDRHQIEAWVTALIRTCRQLTGHRLLPIRVKFTHHRSEDSSELDGFLGCHAVFGADADEVAFAETARDTPVVSADHYLNELLTAYCEQALARRRTRRGGLRTRVENAVVPLLPHGRARVDEVARRLGMSQRTLARRLALEGLTFAGILDQLRSDLANRYLSDADLSISQIAWLLGYREVSAFTHAFKRWTGKTPRETRARSELSQQ